METSTITSKGQITIPKQIREKFNLKPQDKLLFKTDGDRIIMKPITGTILDLKGAFPVRRKIDFERLRKKMMREIAKETLREMKR